MKSLRSQQRRSALFLQIFQIADDRSIGIEMDSWVAPMGIGGGQLRKVYGVEREGIGALKASRCIAATVDR